MAGPRKVSKEEYDELRANMEEKYGYDDMSEEEKADFDAKIDQVAVVGDKTDETDGEETEKDELEEGDLQGDEETNEEDEEAIW